MTMTTDETRRWELHALLGDLPRQSGPVGVHRLAEEEREGFILETLVLDLNGIEPVPAYFVRPKDQAGPLPVILYNHAHGGDYVLGKEELLIGRTALQQPSYADVLTDLGHAALCIDTWAFGERRGRSEGEIFREMLWSGQVMWGMMVHDSLRALDYLVDRPDVDAARIGTLGLSMGSTMAWWVAALDPRVKVCVDICCLTDFDALIASRGLEAHGVYYYVPRLLKHFTTAQINALIAPRPHLSLAGIYDRLTPPAGLDRIDRELRDVYARAGAPEAWHLSRHATGHMETAAMRIEIAGFLDRWL
ncbi:MAG: acetylxylan esterase [Chloroflexota bacterium]|nr:acetylxylan esterase [Chloroflexota bacterium]